MRNSKNNFCSNCGAELNSGANFCNNCGEPIIISSKKSWSDKKNDREAYDGMLYKCPNCEYVLNSFMTKCPACDYELRNRKTTDSIKEFTMGLREIDEKEMPKVEEKTSIMKTIFGTDFSGNEDKNTTKIDFDRQKQQEKIEYIKNFPIPNTNEDILEFMVIVSSNINVNDIYVNELTKTWLLKLEQIYKKAEMIMKKDSDFKKVKEIYDNKKNEIKKQENGIKIALGVLGLIVLFVINPLIGILGTVAITLVIYNRKFKVK